MTPSRLARLVFRAPAHAVCHILIAPISFAIWFQEGAGWISTEQAQDREQLWAARLARLVGLA